MFENMSFEELEEYLNTRKQLLERDYKEIAEALVKLSNEVGKTDAKTLSRKIKDQADKVKSRDMLTELIAKIENEIDLRNQQKEAAKPQYQTLIDFVNDWKEKEIEWFRLKLESGDWKGLSKGDIQLLEQGMTEIKKVIEADTNYRLYRLITQLKNEVGTVTECNIRRNRNEGYDGMVTGIKEGKEITVYFETVLAGGHNIQRLHYRTLINKSLMKLTK